MLWIVLTACGPSEGPEKESEAYETPEMSAEVVPLALEYGVVGLGSPETQPITIYNLGNIDVSLAAVRSSSPELVVVAATNVPIPPGGTGTIEVTWAPEVPEELGATLDLLLSGLGGGGLEEYSVPITGTAAGPEVTLSADAVDFGTVKVGCMAEALLTLSNAGLGDLQIDGMSLGDSDEIEVTATDGTAPPWTLASFESRELKLVYTPRDDGALLTTLTIASNDPVSPALSLNLSAEAIVDAEKSLEFTVLAEGNVTALIAVNAIVPNGMFSERFYDSLPILFDTLQETGAPYRLAFIDQGSGEVEGSTTYLDDSMSTTTSVAIVQDSMLANASGDLDTLLQTLAVSIEANRDWLLDDAPEWEDSKLNLVGMNSDVEQSGGNYVTYLDQYRSYKDDPENIAVHAFAGDSPRGCSGAEPAGANLWSAVDNTGGVFFSICEEDWSTHMETLALAMLGGDQHYDLGDDVPTEWTIRVTVDGVELTEGWTYDAAENEVIFDALHTPTEGSVVEIDYVLAVECP